MILWCEFSTYLDRNEPESIEKVKKIINTILFFFFILHTSRYGKWIEEYPYSFLDVKISFLTQPWMVQVTIE